jgi:fatty acid desaturase
MAAVGFRREERYSAMPTTRTTPSHDLMLTRTTLTPAAGMNMYSQLRRDVIQAGILQRDYRYYAVLTAVVTVGVAVSLVQVVRLPTSVALAFWSLIFSFFAVQLCGIIHDAGHRAIFSSTRQNDIIGEVASCFLAMGFQRWRMQHNAHHARTNEEDKDPDLDIPLHAFTYKRFQSQKGVWRYLRTHQAFLFYPLRVLVVFTRRLASVAYFRDQPFGLRLAAEIALWATGMVGWFVIPFLVFPLAKAILLFVVVHLTMGFYLSNIFAPNHKGMPQIAQGTEISFLERQVRTSRNISPNWLTDALYFGLNYQIEHHLFPNCPRNKLKRITPYVRAICQLTNLQYTEVGILESNRIILAELNNIARPTH